MTSDVDTYLAEGCGRCPLGATPDCKVHRWRTELQQLRAVIIACGLSEESKWGVACYTFQNNNIILLSALKEYCAISFFKGALLADNKGILHKPGPNSQAARLLKFTDVTQIQDLDVTIQAYIYEALEIEKAGLQIEFKQNPEPIPVELENRFEEDPSLKTAFESLTPGRQRAYILHFSAAKFSKTRHARIEKCIPKILNGQGMHDHYKRSHKQ